MHITLLELESALTMMYPSTDVLFRSLRSVRFVMVSYRGLLCSTMLHLLDKKSSVKSNIVEILVQFKMMVFFFHVLKHCDGKAVNLSSHYKCLYCNPCCIRSIYFFQKQIMLTPIFWMVLSSTELYQTELFVFVVVVVLPLGSKQ